MSNELTGKQLVMNSVLNQLNHTSRELASLDGLSNEQREEAFATVYRMKGYLKWLAKQEG